MVEIDGSIGEGGGQVLRSALTLAVLTGTPMHLVNIRARRPKPGMMAQHLQAVEAAAAVADAHVAGAQLGASTLLFEPRGIRCGDFRFDIDTAGSTSLVLQTVLLPLSVAGGESHVTITGGTHVPWSPCFEYLQLQWLHHLHEIGFAAEVQLALAGFYPQGGGRIHATIRPAATLRPLHRTERGALKQIRGISAVANLDLSVAQRQRTRTLQRLAGQRCEIDLVQMPSRFKGTMVLLLAEFERSQCCYTALGARGKPAERVADEAVDGLENFLATDGAVDQHLADQLILPLAIASGVSELRTSEVTLHLVTNVEVVRAFLPVAIEVQGAVGAPGVVRVAGRQLRTS